MGVVVAGAGGFIALAFEPSSCVGGSAGAGGNALSGTGEATTGGCALASFARTRDTATTAASSMRPTTPSVSTAPRKILRAGERETFRVVIDMSTLATRPTREMPVT